MKTKATTIAGLFLLLFTCNALTAETKRYRLTWRDNPSTTISVCFEATSGNNHTVYYGTNNMGITPSAYTLSKEVDKSVSMKGMNNKFVRLSGLTPDTRYYFIVADDNSISDVMYFETIPDDPTKRLSFIEGGDIVQFSMWHFDGPLNHFPAKLLHLEYRHHKSLANKLSISFLQNSEPDRDSFWCHCC